MKGPSPVTTTGGGGGGGGGGLDPPGGGGEELLPPPPPQEVSAHNMLSISSLLTSFDRIGILMAITPFESGVRLAGPHRWHGTWSDDKSIGSGLR
jgi:hypothetical protein